MAKFYVVQNAMGEVTTCEMTKKAAVAQCYSDGYTVTEFTVAVTAENIRRLLGNLGGYADDSRDVR